MHFFVLKITFRLFQGITDIKNWPILSSLLSTVGKGISLPLLPSFKFMQHSLFLVLIHLHKISYFFVTTNCYKFIIYSLSFLRCRVLLFSVPSYFFPQHSSDYWLSWNLCSNTIWQWQNLRTKPYKPDENIHLQVAAVHRVIHIKDLQWCNSGLTYAGHRPSFWIEKTCTKAAVGKKKDRKHFLVLTEGQGLHLILNLPHSRGQMI